MKDVSMKSWILKKEIVRNKKGVSFIVKPPRLLSNLGGSLQADIFSFKPVFLQKPLACFQEYS